MLTPRSPRQRQAIGCLDPSADLAAMPPQKSGTSPASQTSPSDSRIVSSTRGRRNSSLRTSSSTRPWTSCRCCEDAVRRRERFPSLSRGPLFFKTLFSALALKDLSGPSEPLGHPQESNGHIPVLKQLRQPNLQHSSVSTEMYIYIYVQVGKRNWLQF